MLRWQLPISPKQNSRGAQQAEEFFKEFNSLPKTTSQVDLFWEVAQSELRSAWKEREVQKVSAESPKDELSVFQNAKTLSVNMKRFQLKG